MAKEDGYNFKRGNKLWARRSKHGRDKLFATPDLMWDAACEYFSWCLENPLFKKESKVVSSGAGLGSEVEIVDIPFPRPMTLSGMCLYIGCSSSYFRTYKLDKVKCTPDFLSVIQRIEEVIENQLFDYALIGTFNSNLIAFKLGLAQKIITENENVNYNTSITPEEAKAIKEAIEKDI